MLISSLRDNVFYDACFIVSMLRTRMSYWLSWSFCFVFQSLDITQAGLGSKMAVPQRTQLCSSPARRCQMRVVISATSLPSPMGTSRGTLHSPSRVRILLLLSFILSSLPVFPNLARAAGMMFKPQSSSHEKKHYWPEISTLAYVAADLYTGIMSCIKSEGVEKLLLFFF